MLPFFPEVSAVPQYSVPLKSATPEPVIPKETVRKFSRGQKIDLSTKAALSTKKPVMSVGEPSNENKKRDTPVTEDGIFSLWMRFPSQIRDMYGLHFLFSKAPLWNSEKMTITVETSGQLIATELNTVLSKLIKYMRDGLRNDSVNVEISVNESNQDNMDISPKGKATAMAKKNEKLRDLCRRLNLDFT